MSKQTNGTEAPPSASPLSPSFRAMVDRYSLDELVEFHEEQIAEIGRIEHDLGLARIARKEVAAIIAGRLLDETFTGTYQRPGLILQAHTDRLGLHRVVTAPSAPISEQGGRS